MIETERVVLRQWREADAIAHHAMCNDPRITATLGEAPSLSDSRDVVARQNSIFADHGYCFWAMESRGDARFVGWCGIKPGKTPIEGRTEIGWSLLPDLWGVGLAHEAAHAVLAWTWRRTAIREVVAITASRNARSWGLMERLGMTRVVGGDFDHPDLAVGDPLRRHILYRIDRPA